MKILSILNDKAKEVVKINTDKGTYTIGLSSDFGLPYGITELNGDIFKPIHYGQGLKIYNKIKKLAPVINIT